VLLIVKLPADTTVKAAVSLCKYTDKEGFNLAIELIVKTPGLEKSVTEKVITEAHKICPFSNATRDAAEVKLTVE
jgi:lipoyl-dependent peroxiredoxin